MVDARNGRDYAYHRHFVALAGRFLSSDPYEASGGAAEPGSWNRYPYVGGDPVNFHDPRGLQSETPPDERAFCNFNGVTFGFSCDWRHPRVARSTSTSLTPASKSMALPMRSRLASCWSVWRNDGATAERPHLDRRQAHRYAARHARPQRVIATLVHELAHLYDLLYGDEASPKVTPDVNDFDDSACIGSIRLVDMACFSGTVHGN